MKTLQHEAQPAKAKAKMKPEPAKMTKSAAPAPAPAEGFTARELDAAEQLIHLSESSASSGTPRAGAGAGRARPEASGSSSPRSVNAPALAPAPPPRAVQRGPADDYEEEDEREVAGTPRRTRRYRLIAEIYAATEEIAGCSGHKKKE